MTNTGALFFCLICSKPVDDAHSIKWNGWTHGWAIVCPTSLVVEKPLSHCTVTGIEIKIEVKDA